MACISKKIKVNKTLAKKIKKKEGIYYTIDEIDYRMKAREIVKLLEATIYDFFNQFKFTLKK